MPLARNIEMLRVWRGVSHEASAGVTLAFKNSFNIPKLALFFLESVFANVIIRF